MKWPGFACADKLMWKGLRAGGFSVGRRFELNMQGPIEVFELWKGKLHACLKLFLWRVHRGVLSTKDIIFRKTGAGEKNCIVCRDEEETLFHLFKECPGARSLAFATKWGFRLDNWNVNSISEIVESYIKPKVSQESLDGDLMSVFLSSFLYYVWMFRNIKLHSSELPMSKKVLFMNQAVEEFNIREVEVENLVVECPEAWALLAEGWLKVNSDAAFNNGKAGLGLVVRNYKGELVLLMSNVVDCSSAHASEVEALAWASAIVAKE